MHRKKQKIMKRFGYYCLVSILLISCEIVDDDVQKHVDDRDTTFVGLDEVAGILSCLPLESVHLQEVHTAVTSSSSNGYDEEYTMTDLFESPGAGVGDVVSKSGPYGNPLRSLIAEHVRSMTSTKASAVEPEMFLDALSDSDIQIYWPNSSSWDGEGMPVITFDPEDGAYTNIGYRLITDDDGSRRVEEVIVDEEMAMKRPVWVVNRNSDAGYTSLEMLRREDPQWGEGGGAIIVKPENSVSGRNVTKSEEQLSTLILKDFIMHRNYDSWFAGASEFFVKIGYLDDFTASTEAELRLYNPLVTDFMIVVKRNQLGIPQPFNAILMSDWSEQMTSCAFMITEDDGGTREDWSAKAKVYVAGKSYGVEINIPMNSRDDVVWRGELATRWFTQHDGESWSFGDVELTFEIL